MIRFLSFCVSVLLTAVLFTGPAAAQDLKPQVDAAQVTSWATYQALQSFSLVRKRDRETENYKASEAKKTGHFMEYETARLAALRELRTADRSHYLEWLDAKALKDDAEVLRLQATIPAIAAYVKKQEAAWRESSRKIDIAAEEKTAKDAVVQRVYEEEQRLLREAYDALQKNKS
jgi:hypothetical protein